MPDAMDSATRRGSSPATLLPLRYPSLTEKGSAPKFSKRTILAGRELSPVGILFFSHLPSGYTNLK
jgi:hypothetical protein